MSNTQQTVSAPCPYEDCQHTIPVPLDIEEADIIVCRTNDEVGSGIQGCNRNTEVIAIIQDDTGNIVGTKLATLEVDEDWGE